MPDHTILDTNICAQNQISPGTCNGDLGSPLTSKNIDETIIGVASWSPNCQNGSPDVYTRISSFRPWILSVSGV